MFPSEEFDLREPELQWFTRAPKTGQPERGWVSGPLVLVTCHHTAAGGDKPCRSIITRGAVKCACEDAPVSARQKGYLPLRKPDGGKVVILMCATTAKRAVLLARGTPVEFWRAPGKTQPLNVKVLLPEELGLHASANKARQSPDDIRPYLIHVLWQDPVLCRHFPRAGACAPEPEAVKPIKDSRRAPLVPPVAARDNTPSLNGILKQIAHDPNAG